MKPVTTQGQNSIDVYLPGKDEVSKANPNLPNPYPVFPDVSVISM